ncbi:MAG: hypothetical protein K2Q20_08100 [Phycisphaerales bacterium]|nr:hypothetical protein [Phycisphaerales bacterium]
MTTDRSPSLEARMSSFSTKSRLGLCAIIGVALAAIPGCSAAPSPPPP